MIVVSISQQALCHRSASGRWRRYAVSTSAHGCGNEYGSYKTPLGRHRICAKIGAGLPMHTAFVGRRPVGIYVPGTADPDRDWILTRILWLQGMELGRNRRGRVDSKRRHIYIHGTHAEDQLGRPASHGCIRMANADILDLFTRVRIGERVLIRP